MGDGVQGHPIAPDPIRLIQFMPLLPADRAYRNVSLFYSGCSMHGMVRQGLQRVALHATITHDQDISAQRLEGFFETGSMADIQAAHALKLGAMLRRLNEASDPQGMNLPGWRLHALKGKALQGHFSVRVNGNWRLTFRFDGSDSILVDYQDYH